MSLTDFVLKKAFVKRYDDDHIIHYFSYKDFPGMQARPVQFSTPQNLNIRGMLYSYPGARTDDLVVFCHGMGGGHRSYMREIDVICKKGYEVLAYDNIGCFESEGEDIRGLSESVNDLVCCMDWLANEESLKDRRLHVMGHSWGGFAAANILNFRQRNIAGVTVISAFASIDAFSDAGFGGQLKLLKQTIARHERKVNPGYAATDCVTAFRDTPVKVLWIHSRDDHMADISTGLDYVRSRVSNPNVSYLETDGKHHNPNYTTDAVDYLMQTFGEYESLIKKRKLRTFDEKKAYMDTKDFRRMTEQDPAIWDAIFAHMEKADA